MVGVQLCYDLFISSVSYCPNMMMINAERAKSTISSRVAACWLLTPVLARWNAPRRLLEAFLFFCSNSRSVSTTSVFNTVPYWRRKHGLPAQGKEYGPITDLPDWSYADGRPAPLKESHKMRKKLQIEYCEKIIKLTKEVDECFELNKEKEDFERQKRQNVIQNRLKQKRKVFM